MAVKIGINGFGRIGKCVMRAALNNPDVEVVAINDTGDIEGSALLFKHDSIHGNLSCDVSVEGEYLVVDGKKTRVFCDRDPAKLDWSSEGVEVVIECTGVFRSREKAAAHLGGTVKKVIISAPGKDEDKTIVMGVNESEYDPATHHVVSNASCTTNCLAPMAKALNDKFGVVEGLMTTIHGYTGDQNTLDAPHAKGDLRRARAAAVNIVPNTTGAAKAIGLVIPELNGKLDGAAQRVPVPTGSLTELVTVLEKPVTAEEINAAMKELANESYGYTEDPIVSSDIVGITYGSLFDATQTKVMTVGDKQLVKTVAWYDNEMSYTAQLVRTLEYFAKL